MVAADVDCEALAGIVAAGGHDAGGGVGGLGQRSDPEVCPQHAEHPAPSQPGDRVRGLPPAEGAPELVHAGS
jgi:hypothetical protein